MTDMSNIDIVYQQNHIEIYHVTGTIYDDSKILWYDRQRGLSEKDILQDPIYMDDLENRMPPKEFRRFDFYRTWIYDMVDIFRSYSQFFIVTYCPSDINTFDQESPRSIVSICRKDGNTIIIDSLQVTVAGLLWELHGGNEQNMIPRYRRTRETSTEPMFEAFFIYMIKMYSELKYGSVSPSDGTYSLLNIWFDIYSNDSDELIVSSGDLINNDISKQKNRRIYEKIIVIGFDIRFCTSFNSLWRRGKSAKCLFRTFS